MCNYCGKVLVMPDKSDTWAAQQPTKMYLGKKQIVFTKYERLL